MPLLRGENTKDEKINGVIYDMSSEKFQHGIINGNIHNIIKNALKDSICLPFTRNLDYKYHPQVNDDYVVPDVMIVCDRKHLKGGSYLGHPKFIVETLSPATALRDMTVKKDIYQEAGIEEYWIVSPRERGVQIYYLIDGKYSLEYRYILQDDKDEPHYNADTVITLKEFPYISMTLAEVFENVD